MRVPDDEAGSTALDFLARRFLRVPRATWEERFRRGLVLGRDQQPSSPDKHLSLGDRLYYFREVPAEPRIPFREKVLLHTEHFLVVDKPPFLPVIPGGRWVRECLLGRLTRSTGLEELAPAHRLDRHTAGLVLFCIHPEHRHLYTNLFARRGIERDYSALAFLRRAPERTHWRVEGHLEPGEPWFRMRSRPAAPGERPTALTHVELHERLPGLAGEPEMGRFRLRPETGKKHQLRVHMADLGFPLVGDPLYPEVRTRPARSHLAGEEIESDGAEIEDYAAPLQLLARRLAFRDPVTGEDVNVESERCLTRTADD